MYKLTKKRKWMVYYLYSIRIDTWKARHRTYKIKTAIAYCRNNPEWENYWYWIENN